MQKFHHLHNFTPSQTGYQYEEVLANQCINSEVAIRLSIGDSTIGYVIQQPEIVDSIRQEEANLQGNAAWMYSSRADIWKAINDMGVKTGRYTLTVAAYQREYFKWGYIHDNVVSSQEEGAQQTQWTIRRISDSRTEIIVHHTQFALHATMDGNIMYQNGNWIPQNYTVGSSQALDLGGLSWEQGPPMVFKEDYEYALQINGQLYTILNAAQYDPNDKFSAVLKLDRPLTLDVEEDIIVPLVRPFGSIYSTTVDIQTVESAIPGIEIRPPDFTVPATKYANQSTNYLNRQQIITPPEGQTSESLNTMLYKALSGSGVQSADLGIDYRYWENFIHFGSALEQLENFKYKLELIEHYSESMRVLSSSHASESYYNQQNMRVYESRSSDIINNFSGYERHLYYKSGSDTTSSLDFGTPLSSSTWPKIDSTYPYTNSKTTDASTVAWFTTHSIKARDYDLDNIHNLEKTIPVHVRVDDQNANYLTFVHMIGQHFDQLWSYVSHINKLYDRDERFNIGISKDILHSALGSLGWTGQSGYAIDDLWSYFNGQPFSGSTFDIQAVQGQNPTEDITKEIWNRTINNLPYLLKTRGTERGVKALLATYGMPSTLLQVSEYGGAPKSQSGNNHLKQEYFNRSLQFRTQSYCHTVWPSMNGTEFSVPASNNKFTGPDGFEIRIRPTFFNEAIPSGSVIAYKHWYGKTSVILYPHISCSNTNSAYYQHGKVFYGDQTGSGAPLSIVGGCTNWLPLYDGDWWNIELARKVGGEHRLTSTDSGIRLKVAKAADHGNGKITHSGSVFIPWPGGFRSGSTITGWDTNGSYDYSSSETRRHFLLGKSQSADPYVTLENPQDSSVNGIAQQGSNELDYGVSNVVAGYSGSMQELRFWYHTDTSTAAYLEDESFNNHVKDPRSIEGNSSTGSYSDLIMRFPLGSDNVVKTLSNTHQGAYMDNVAPQGYPRPFQSASNPTAETHLTNIHRISMSFFTGNESDDWAYEEETYYTAMPDIIGNRAISDKIRVDKTPLYSGQLHQFTSSLSSSIELAGPDSPIVGVHFSPTHHISIDQAHQIGGSALDDAIGNPRDTYRGEYKELRAIRNHYWRKYNDRPTFQAYMNVLQYFDKSLFKQVDTMLPGRAIKQVGLEIRPTILERNTIEQRSMSMDDVTINESKWTFDTDYQKHGKTATFDGNMASSSIALYEYGVQYDSSSLVNNYGTLNPKIYALKPFEDNYAYTGTPNRTGSYPQSSTEFYQIEDLANDDVPNYGKPRKSILRKRVDIHYLEDGRPLSRSLVEADAQDYRAGALQNLYFDGCKIGKNAGTIGGVIMYRGSDPTLTYPGIIPGILAAIEVVETNPNTVAVQDNPTTIALPELLIR